MSHLHFGSVEVFFDLTNYFRYIFASVMVLTWRYVEKPERLMATATPILTEPDPQHLAITIHVKNQHVDLTSCDPFK